MYSERKSFFSSKKIPTWKVCSSKDSIRCLQPASLGIGAVIGNINDHEIARYIQSINKKSTVFKTIRENKKGSFKDAFYASCQNQ